MSFRLPRSRIFRLLTVLAALCAVGAQGIAAASHVRSCALQMAHAQSGAGAQVAAPGDCCPTDSNPMASCDLGANNQLPAQSDLCSACKAGYNCKSPQSFEPTPVLLTFVAPTRSVVSACSSRLPPSHSPEGLWRPPALI